MSWLVRLLWLIAIPLEIQVARLLDEPTPTEVPIALGLHVVAATVFAASLLQRTRRGWLWAWPLLGWTLSLLAFPLLGMVATVLAFLLNQTIFRRRSEAAAAELKALAVAEPYSEFEGLLPERRVSLIDDLEVEPVIDVLRADDPELKRAAIDAITKQRGPEAIRVLMGLLHDPSPEARFFASIGLSKLEDEISQAILATQRALAETPGAPEARARLGELYLEYALSGFLDPLTQRYYLGLARDTLEALLQLDTYAVDTALRLARVHILLDDLPAAAELLDAATLQAPENLDASLLRMEVYYRAGELRGLATYASAAAPAVASAADDGELVSWWAGAPTPQPAGIGRPGEPGRT